MPYFHRHVSVAVAVAVAVPVAKYVRITFIRKIRKKLRSLRKNNVLRFRKFAAAFHPFI